MTGGKQTKSEEENLMRSITSIALDETVFPMLVIAYNDRASVVQWEFTNATEAWEAYLEIVDEWNTEKTKKVISNE